MSKIENQTEREDKFAKLDNLVFKTEVLTCFNTTFSNYLKMKGLEISESELYFICGHISPNTSIYNVRMRRFALPYVQFDVLIKSLLSDTNTSYDIFFDKEYQFISLDTHLNTLKDKSVMLAISTAVLPHLLFPNYPYTGSIHCIVTTGIDDDNKVKITDFFNVDANGLVSTWNGEYDYDSIKDQIMGYVHINQLDIDAIEKKKANLLFYAMREFDRLVCDTELHPRGGLGFVEDLFESYERETGKDVVLEGRDVFRMNLMLQAKHLLFFGYTCDLINKYPLKDGENMCKRLKEIKYAWQRVMNKLLIQTLAYNKKRTATILADARELLKQQRELVLELMEMYRQEYKV